MIPKLFIFIWFTSFFYTYAGAYFFDFPDETFLVVSLMSEPPVFKEGINRLVAHVSNHGSGDCSDE